MLNGWLNTYVYVEARPLNMIDPDGLQPMMIYPGIREAHIQAEAKHIADGFKHFMDCVACTVKDQIRGLIPGLVRDYAIEKAVETIEGKDAGKFARQGAKKLFTPIKTIFLFLMG